jgi:cell division protein FtsQ
VVTTAFERRRREERRRRTLRRAALVSLLAGPPALLAAVAFSPVADVDTVEVSGTKRLQAAAVRDAAEVRDGGPLLTVDTDAVRRRVTAIQGVKSATVTRHWPGGVSIAVVERVPVVAVPRPGSVDLYDVDGVLVGTAPSAPKATPSLAVTSGDPSREVVTAAVALLRSLPAPLRKQVSGLRADGAASLSFDLADGAGGGWGSGDRTPEKVRALTLLLPQHAKRYDLRVPDRPAVVPR